jgi:hypothetical protein
VAPVYIHGAAAASWLWLASTFRSFVPSTAIDLVGVRGLERVGTVWLERVWEFLRLVQREQQIPQAQWPHYFQVEHRIALGSSSCLIIWMSKICSPRAPQTGGGLNYCAPRLKKRHCQAFGHSSPMRGQEARRRCDAGGLRLLQCTTHAKNAELPPALPRFMLHIVPKPKLAHTSLEMASPRSRNPEIDLAEKIVG